MNRKQEKTKKAKRMKRYEANVRRKWIERLEVKDTRYMKDADKTVIATSLEHLKEKETQPFRHKGNI